MRLRISSLLAALIVCVGFMSACTGEKSGGEVLVESAPKPEEKILTFFAPVDGRSSGAIAYRKLIDQYNASHPGLHVVFEGIATADGFNGYLEERLDAGLGDDVFIVNEDSVKPLFSKGYFYDLSGIPAYEKLNDAAKVQAVIKDTVYCIPVNMTAYALFVNLDLLDRHGLRPPETIDEFLACCQTIRAAGGTPISISRWHATAVPTIANGLYRLYGSDRQQELLDELNSGELQIGGYMLEGFGLFQRFIREGWYGGGLDGAAVDALKAGARDIPDFAENKTAFYFGPLEYIPWVEELNPALNYQVQGIPVPGGTVAMPTAVSRLCVNADSKYLADALDFVSYLTDGVYQQSIQNGEMLLPAYDGVDFVLQNERIRPVYETFLSGAQVPPEDMRLNFTCWDTVQELCVKMFDGMTPEEAADEYNRIQAEQLSAHNSETAAR